MRIGIDLGTTTSTVVGLGPDGNLFPPFLIDSLAAWRNGHIFFGEDANAALLEDPSHTFPIRDLKLKLGEKSIKVGGNSLDVDEIVKQFFKFLAEKIAPGQEIEEAVIGTPVNVSEKHRNALLQCAKNAGFKTSRLVYEPSSALVGAMELDDMARENIILIVDWGGGTLDLSLIKKSEDHLQEIAVDGDFSLFGGSQMDESILKKTLDSFPSVKDRLASIQNGFELLKIEAEIAKKEILESASPETDCVEIAPRWLKDSLTFEGKKVTEVAIDVWVKIGLYC